MAVGGQEWAKKLRCPRVVMLEGSVVFLLDGSISQDDDRNSLGEEDIEAGTMRLASRREKANSSETAW